MNTITNLKVPGKGMRRLKSLQKKIQSHLPAAFFVALVAVGARVV